MDLLKLIKEKAQFFSKSEDDNGISSVVNHIEIAEHHYENGKSGSDYLFNDTIYRSNQAFEGSLKEAYRIITGKDSKKITPYKIEQYFEANDILKERVLQLFKNYRTEWRNETTHNYRLYISEQEAFLAIVNISAFINILFDQMIQKRAYDIENQELKKSPPIRNLYSKDEPIAQRVSELLFSFSKEISNKMSGTTIPRIKEVELIGSLTAFINNLATDLEVFPEYSILRTKLEGRYFADFLIRNGEEKLIVEIKIANNKTSHVLSAGTRQLMNYLTASKITNGILYIPPRTKNEELITVNISNEVEGVTYNIKQIFSKNSV